MAYIVFTICSNKSLPSTKKNKLFWLTSVKNRVLCAFRIWYSQFHSVWHKKCQDDEYIMTDELMKKNQQNTSIKTLNVFIKAASCSRTIVWNIMMLIFSPLCSWWALIWFLLFIFIVCYDEGGAAPWGPRLALVHVLRPYMEWHLALWGLVWEHRADL